MKLLTFPNGWYSDALPGGVAYVVSPYVRGGQISKHTGAIDIPGGERLLYTVLADDGVQVAGVGNDGDIRDRALRWDGQRWHDHGEAFGPYAVIFDKENRLRVLTGPPAVGYRYVDETGNLITLDETRGDQARRIWDYTQRGSITVGQGGAGIYGEDPLIAILEGKRLLLATGQCRHIRFRQTGRDIALAWVQEVAGVLTDDGEELIDLPRGAVCLWLTVDELAQFPAARDTATPPPPPPPPPDKPGEPPVYKSVPIPSDVQNTIRRYADKFPLPQLPEGVPAQGEALEQHEENCRIWMRGLAQQLEFSHPDQEFGLKRADPGRPTSKDFLPRKVGSLIEGWDLMVGAGTGLPSLNLGALSKDVSDQVFESVPPVDFLGGGEPPEPPQPPDPPDVDLGLVARLVAVEQAIETIKASQEAQRLAILDLTAVTGSINVNVGELARIVRPLGFGKLRVKGNTSRDWGHSHKIDLPVVVSE